MRLTAVTRAVGKTLARDLPAVGAGAVPLLRAGSQLTERLCQAVIDQGVHAVWVADELSEGIEPVELIPSELRREASQSAKAALDAASEALIGGQGLADSVLVELSAVAQRIAEMVGDTPDAALALTDLAAADQYTHRHSVNVCALGLLIGATAFRRDGWVDWDGRRRYDRVEERLSKLGLGLLLHDIGKLAVPTEILNKPSALDAAEWEIMRTHPEAGVALLPADSVSPLVKAVVRDHHERWDGGGYPRGIAGEEINGLARIAAIADVYDAVTSERPYKKAAPAHVGVKVICDGSGSAFDPDLVSVFRSLVFPFPVGTELTLEDGASGVVASVDPSSPEVPVVRFQGPDGPVQIPVDTSRQRVEVTV